MITSEQIEQIKQKSFGVARLARLEMLNAMEEESKDNLKK